jgi:hypothetical protein
MYGIHYHDEEKREEYSICALLLSIYPKPITHPSRKKKKKRMSGSDFKYARFLFRSTK